MHHGDIRAMSVICDTSRLSIYRDRNAGNCSVCIKGLKNRNGGEVKFSVSKDMNLSDEELFTLFFEKLERREFRQNVRTGGGWLCQNDNGDYYLDYGDGKGVALKKTAEKQDKPSVTDGRTLFDTHAPEVRALVGSPVIGSSTYVFSEGTCVMGVLDSVNGVFHVRTADGVVQCPFIRVRRPDPLNLSDRAVRRALMGRVVVSKDGRHELMLNSMVRDGMVWKANGLTAGQLMNNYLFDDGTEISASA